VNELLLFAALGSPEPPPSFSALPPAPPPAVAVAPQLVRPSADPEWRDEYRPEYGGWVKVRTVPAATKGGVVPGVTSAPPRPFPAGGTTDSIQGTGARTPPASTSPPTARTTEPGRSRGATPTAPTTTGAGSAVPAGGTKFLVSERTDELGNKWQYYSDGSVTICSAFG
jgi:hypothetical protein